MNRLFAGLSTTVFERMSALAREHGAVNLGQGFPDDQGPLDVREHAAQAVVHGNNQYPPLWGLPALREAIATHYARWQSLDYDPHSEVMVTSGATEALAAATLALIEPGDEVLLFEPLYDAYLPLVRRAGGVARLVALAPPRFGFDAQRLTDAFTPRTKVVVLNDPQNPAATVLAAADLQLLAELCVRHEVTVICDEVWEHVVFDGHRHRPLASYPGMRERCVKIGSAGKIFQLTGWKVGLVCAPAPLLSVLGRAHQYLTFTTPPNLQSAVAYGLGKDAEYFESMRIELQARRDHFVTGLERLGLRVLPSAATYFVNVDLAPLGVRDDVAFCEWLVREHALAAIPVSAFYPSGAVTTLVRFCFAKQRATLDLALERLEAALATAGWPR